MPVSPTSEADAALGRALRVARREQGLTLRQVAAAAGLSQPFLSQLELGQARPSMRSLWAIAEALGTTQQALLAASSSAPGTVGAEQPVLPVDRPRDGTARLLMHDPDGADVTEFVGAVREWGEFFTHAQRELLYVVRGTFEVELAEEAGPRRLLLPERGSLAYAGTTPHRFRQVGTESGVLLMIHGARGDHA